MSEKRFLGLDANHEYGPTGYALYWQLTGLGVECQPAAPALVRVKSGDSVKIDRRDALKAEVSEIARMAQRRLHSR